MKVLLISGNYPPISCGIGDYTFKLSEALKLSGVEVVVLANINWGIFNFFNIKKIISNINPDVIHIQYPSTGYGFSLVPQLISLLYKTIVTIHEVSQSHWIRKLSLFPFSLRSTLIFTNKFEFEAYKKLFIWRKLDCHIIAIGSNISESVEIVDIHKRDFTKVIYFGQIRPQKGMEDLITLAKLIKEQGLAYKVVIVGQLVEHFRSYYEQIYNSAKDLGIDWKLNLSENAVIDILKLNMLCYLPFPDGASGRRGSLFAALNNKMLVFTTEGLQTTFEIKRTIFVTKSANDVIRILSQSTKDDFIREVSIREQYIKSLIKSISWPEIANLHIRIYNCR